MMVAVAIPVMIHRGRAGLVGDHVTIAVLVVIKLLLTHPPYNVTHTRSSTDQRLHLVCS